jgi:hypothetical protein
MANETKLGSFIPLTRPWEVNEIAQADVQSPQFKELIVRLYQYVNQIAISVNTKETAYYALTEFVTGQLFFPNPASNQNAPLNKQYRQAYRKTFYITALVPGPSTTVIPHGITVTSETTWTHIYGTMTDTVNLLGIPLPYSSFVLNQNITLRVDATNIYIVTGIDYSSYNKIIVVLEYLQN